MECGVRKVPRLPRKTTGQPAVKHSKRSGFPASPIDTATPQENQTRNETRGCKKTSISCETSSNIDIFHTLSNKFGMSQSATPATQNDMTTCLETFEKDMCSSFPHRHGDATGKPETRDETRGCRKTNISYETSSNFDIFHTSSNRLECHKVPRLPRKTT